MQAQQRQTRQSNTPKKRQQTSKPSKAVRAKKVKKQTAVRKVSATKYIVGNLIKILVVLILMAILFAVGLMIGFGVIGGESATQIFSPRAWEHVWLFFN